METLTVKSGNMEINKGRTHTIRNKHGYASSKTEIPQNIRRH